MPPIPFRFLGLPMEPRLMVYQLIVPRIRYHEVLGLDPLTLLLTSLPGVQILYTWT